MDVIVQGSEKETGRKSRLFRCSEVVARPVSWDTVHGRKGRRTVRSRHAPSLRRSLARRALVLGAVTLAPAAAIPSVVAAPAGTARVVASAPTPSVTPLDFAASSPPGGAHRDARVGGSGPVTYHGGPVQHSSAVYPIFWAPSGYSFPANYQGTISQYF